MEYSYYIYCKRLQFGYRFKESLSRFISDDKRPLFFLFLMSLFIGVLINYFLYII